MRSFFVLQFVSKTRQQAVQQESSATSSAAGKRGNLSGFVIASQRARWRGNPFPYSPVLRKAVNQEKKKYGLPHQSVDWFAMTGLVVHCAASTARRAEVL